MRRRYARFDFVNRKTPEHVDVWLIVMTVSLYVNHRKASTPAPRSPLRPAAPHAQDTTYMYLGTRPREHVPTWGVGPRVAHWRWRVHRPHDRPSALPLPVPEPSYPDRYIMSRRWRCSPTVHTPYTPGSQPFCTDPRLYRVGIKL